MSSQLNLAATTRPVLVIHGGAGTMPKDERTAEKDAAIRADLVSALTAGSAILRRGGSSLDAVSAAVVVLEDSPWFNAGKGAVFNADGVNELDASIMEGKTKRAGAVAGVHRVKNPVLLAAAIMQQSRHVMMIGDGAEKFATQIGMELVDPKYFYTEFRWNSLLKARADEAAAVPENRRDSRQRLGTVGAVALDKEGNLAAATSTGGMTNKRFGRVGDSPLIGAGTYADSGCAVSATGWGEFFIRATVAKEICARVQYGKQSVSRAAAETLDEVARLGGDGGVIVLDHNGRFTAPFNTPGMYRAWIDADGKIETKID